MIRSRRFYQITIILIALNIIAGSVQGGRNRQKMRQNDDQPTVIVAVSPIFPPTAVATNTSGDVSLEVTINAKGVVTSARTVEGHPLLRRISEDTARRWRFAPLDQADIRLGRIIFTFRIMPKATPADELTPVFMPPNKVEVRHWPYEHVVDSDPRSDKRLRQRNRRGKL